MKFDFLVDIRKTSRRKTAEIRIIDSQVVVAVPNTLSEQRIQSIISKRKGWITKKLALQAQMPAFKPKEFVSGEAFSYLGRNYRLKLTRNDGVKLKNGYFHVGNAAKGKSYIKTAIENWFRIHAANRLIEKTQRYAELLGVSPRSIKVKDFKTKWGSCSIHGDIAYNWRIIMAPHGVVDYVVVHELSHLVEHNHSRNFWQAVEKTMPNYREKKQWLKLHGQHLAW